ncbi:LOW QUALITY PROTEIN: protein FAM163B [Lethenteron reissneri]|uniref:LOW QUALITY PROTEIN: protein FAM163B n=1 Tax=Lethenteron reissneri TaxID=7753 RepID=UPI002AB70793|nr:LOW QUALITY PROTEIN: protein FAM163B [Lethenteron reissneri]
MTAGTVVITGGILATVILLCIIAVLCYCRLQYYCCKREDLDSDDGEQPDLTARPASPDSRCSEPATDGKCNHLPVGRPPLPPPPRAPSCRHQWPPRGDRDPWLPAGPPPPASWPDRLDCERRTCRAAARAPYGSPFYVHVSPTGGVRNGGERVACSPPPMSLLPPHGFPAAAKRPGHFGGFSHSVSTEV